MEKIDNIITTESDLSTFRLDKNVAFNILDFNKIENEQIKNISKSLLLYFALQFQKDLFGYRTIDLDVFAEKMGFSKTNLSRNFPEKKNNLEWNTYFERALYLLSTTTIFEEYKGTTATHNFVGIKNFVIVKEIVKYTSKTKTGGKPKKYYRYKLDPTFEENLKRFFLPINLETYLAAKKFNGQDFYLQLKNIYHSNSIKGINTFNFNFNYITDYFNVSHKEVRKQKQLINAYFKKYESLLKDEIKGISFYWTKEGEKDKYSYCPVVTWTKIDIDILKEQNKFEIDQLFLTNLRRNLYDVFINQNKVRSNFYTWINEKENDEIIKTMYVSTHLLQYKKKTYPSPEHFATQFIHKRNGLKGKNLYTLFVLA